MHFKGSPFHRIVPDFLCHGGDITHGNGKGGQSIYGKSFADENFTLPHRPGCISMANRGPNTNNSQFFMTLRPTSWLDGKHVVFGRVVHGMRVLEKMEAMADKDVIIENCGSLYDMWS